MFCNKKIVLVILIVANAIALHAQKTTTICFTNPTSLQRTDELIIISREQLERKTGFIPATKYIVAKDYDKQRVIVQHDDNNGDGLWDEIVLLQSFRPKEKKIFTISFSNAPSEINATSRAHVRHRRKNMGDGFDSSLDTDSIPAGQSATDFSKEILPPFLTEGPAWENDKVGFRTYFDVRNTKDIWGKTTDKMVLDEVGVDHTKNYHQLSDWGMDILKVGNSLGAGSLALSIKDEKGKDTLVRLGGLNMGKIIYEKVSDGPLRAVFRLNYPNWKVLDGLPLASVTEEISIWGGQYFFESKVSVYGAPRNAALVCGFANFESKQSHVIDTSSHVILYSYDVQSENKDGLGMAISINKKNVKTTGKTPGRNTDVQNSYILTSVLQPKRPVVFRFYSAWEKTNSQFKSEEGFKSYLLQQMANLQHPIIVSFK